jgi:hypothetical protein
LSHNEILPKAAAEGTFDLKSKCISNSQNVWRYFTSVESRYFALANVYIEVNVQEPREKHSSPKCRAPSFAKEGYRENYS